MLFVKGLISPWLFPVYFRYEIVTYSTSYDALITGVVFNPYSTDTLGNGSNRVELVLITLCRRIITLFLKTQVNVAPPFISPWLFSSVYDVRSYVTWNWSNKRRCGNVWAERETRWPWGLLCKVVITREGACEITIRGRTWSECICKGHVMAIALVFYKELVLLLLYTILFTFLIFFNPQNKNIPAFLNSGD